MIKFYIVIFFSLLFNTSLAQDVIIVTETIESIPLLIGGTENNWIDPIDIEPKFPGGDLALFDFIKMNLEYPPTCVKGVVYVKFLITECGEIDSIHVIRGVNEEMDRAAMNVIRAMPNWIPAIKGTENVPIYFTIPVGFAFTRP